MHLPPGRPESAAEAATRQFPLKRDSAGYRHMPSRGFTRAYGALNEPASARLVALRWAAAAPRDEAPYREWAMALEDAHRHAAARDVLLVGRRALGRAGAFGIELAELSKLSGDWEGAAREWAAALPDAPAQLPNAASALAEA